MQDRFAERITQPAARADTRLLGGFAGIYCRGRHRGASRARLRSDGVEAGVYGRRVPVVCEECADLLRYAEQRRAMCPKDPKPFCSNCDTHCYKPGMRESMREVMRYSGPRAVFHGYAVQGIRHLIESRRAAKARVSLPPSHGD
jgi:RNase P subunit RPR2